MNKNNILYILIFFLIGSASAQTNNQDIKSYKFNIVLNDNNDTIDVVSTIKGITHNNTVTLNLEKSMIIQKIESNNLDLTYGRINDSLYITVYDKDFSLDIHYRGKPIDGLIIGKNKYGSRTFFGDNWPNRAKNWLTVYDHPSDKAKVEFIVTAPSKYTVVSNGKLVSMTTSKTSATYNYKTTYELSTKLMVIGVAEFLNKNVQKMPFEISSFAYPKDKYTVLENYSIAPQITLFYEGLLGRYPFNKLYNVQSTTKYGGMENAGCIFYDENVVEANRTESLIAHEIAHQWFGNAVSEKDWNHLWLSEGFATYLENMYLENKYGKDTLDYLMNESRLRVLAFKNKYPNKVLVPEVVNSPNEMLNTYSYQKGAWVLHMLRIELGDDTFFKILKTFYSAYKYSNANTNDFISVASKVSEVNIKPLLEPWLYSNTLPKYDVKWTYSDGKIIGEIVQQQGDTFKNTIDLLIKYSNTSVLKRVKIESKNQSFEFSSNTSPNSVILDPHNSILKDK